ncbi:hypothetical protein [Desulfomonile tiedjei]|uniref:Uncharacterized protein n=1 Tax=Desulfomonile tiedjei (strain ATCC 49306 / DSM 6799 / DCB-1) TaxID=706587 RepID=I4C191_DESTA|nr:hypothetical protein [Desulfomonile tiedjei]AFM23332.1 hypothetical protein Desti_0604 [Desulfomonile tiedjei DSM 6799]
MNNTNSTIKIGIGMLKIIAAVESMSSSIERKIEAPVPMSGACRLKADAIEENLTKIYTALNVAVEIQSAISLSNKVKLDRILSEPRGAKYPDISIIDDDSAASSLKSLRKAALGTNSTLLDHMESIFRNLRSEENVIAGDQTTRVEARLLEVEDIIEKEMTVIEHLLADLSDSSVAM